MVCILRDFFVSSWSWLVMGPMILACAGTVVTALNTIILWNPLRVMYNLFIGVGCFGYVVLVNILLIIARSC
jgi:high-affinity Fe2+/Pb2+ permease